MNCFVYIKNKKNKKIIHFNCHKLNVCSKSSNLIAGDYLHTVSNTMMINDSMFVCSEMHVDARTHFSTNEDSFDALPTIYFVTPTYPRREQIAEITRLGQTLMHIPKLHWIVADDSDSCNAFLDHLLRRFGKYNRFNFLFLD